MPVSNRQLEGKVALVTGAARRIGRSIALRLADHGARVAVHYGTSEAEALATAERCGGRAFQADLTDIGAITRLFDQVESELGPLDLFVNNAARYREMNVLEVTEQDWDSIHDVNLKAAFFCCQQAAKRMRGRGGRIVILSSLGAMRPWTRHAPYCASKHGILGLTRTAALETAQSGIRVNAVCPGSTDTPMLRATMAGNPRIEKMILASQPGGRLGLAEEVAEAVVWLCSERASFVSGDAVRVDGGALAR